MGDSPSRSKDVPSAPLPNPASASTPSRTATPTAGQVRPLPPGVPLPPSLPKTDSNPSENASGASGDGAGHARNSRMVGWVRGNVLRHKRDEGSTSALPLSITSTAPAIMLGPVRSNSAEPVPPVRGVQKVEPPPLGPPPAGPPHTGDGPGPANGTAKAEAPHTIKPPEHEALRKAMLHGRHPQVQDILRGHPGLVNQAITGDGGTAVHFAIRHGNGNSGTEKECLELLDLLSDIPGVNWNARDRWKRTPLHLACASSRGYGQVADFLLYHRANPNLLDDDDSSPLHDAVTDGQKIMVGILLKSQLINAGFPSGTDQRTALHKAAYRGHLEIAAMLLDHDAEVVHMKDAEGHTPLHDASRQNRPETALMLIEANADVNAKTKTGATPLHLAAANNAVEVVKVLLRADAWPFSINNNKETPEMVAERKGHTAILDLLRLPFDIDSSLASGGQALQVTRPTESQRTASKDFTGFIWPSIDGHSKYDKASVFDMLYADEPKLKKSRKDKDVRWIHVPSNNRTWIEDVFKVVYSSEESGNGKAGIAESSKGKGEAQDVRSPEQAEFSTSLKDVLRFINSQFNEFDSECLHRPPHFKVSYGNRPEIDKFRMFSLVFPVLDADMQQPVYFDPNPNPPPITHPASKPDAGMDENQKERVGKLDALAAAYPDTLNKCRTLDGYIHEFIDEADLNFRNGDQVVSRFVERIRCDTWKSKRFPGKPEPVPETLKEQPRTRRRRRRISVSAGAGANGDDMHANRTLKASVGDVVAVAAQPVIAVAMGEAKWDRKATPSQLESQDRSRPASVRAGPASPNRMLARAKTWLPNRVRTELSQLAPKREHSFIPDYAKWTEDAETLDSDNDQDNESEPVEKCVRQQILTVPQIWLWAVENTVVTAYPEGWRVATDRSTLPQAIMRALLKRRSSSLNAGNTTVDGLIQEIVMAALEFEPSISTFSVSRGYLDAFATEVSFASSKVTKCYESFKSTLGTTLALFPKAIKTETDLLVRVDDIVNEISMVRRVQQDQDHVCISMRIAAHQAQRGGQGQGGQRNKKGGGGGGWGGRRDGRTAANVRHELAVERGVNGLRSPKSQHVQARLQRLEEDAVRVRKSIITLLDLRQRQATTENAISSGKQSALLFAQSKVLFVFTAATVIFAPLSWVSSLMALNIENFSPGKDQDWPRAGVAGASASSVVSTLLLCVIGWAAYDWRVKKRDQKAEAKEKEKYDEKPGM